MAAFEGRSPEALRVLIEGKSDEEIDAALALTGVAQALDVVFAGMAGAFLPDRAAGQSVVVQYDVTSQGSTHSYQLEIAGGGCRVEKGGVARARVTLILGAPDFLRLVSGKLSGQTAFFQGRLKLSGDMMFAQTLQTWFRSE